jgi:hypothetical protein
MTAPTRIYLVSTRILDRDNIEVDQEIQHHLVRATNAARALNHVAKKTLAVSVASQDDLITLTKRGVHVQVPDAGDDE